MDKEVLIPIIEATSERAYFFINQLGRDPAEYKPGNLSEAIHFIYSLHEQPLTHVDDLAGMLNEAYDISEAYLDDCPELDQTKIDSMENAPYTTLHNTVLNYLYNKTAADSVGFDSIDEAQEAWVETKEEEIYAAQKRLAWQPNKLLDEFEFLAQDRAGELVIEDILEPLLYETTPESKEEFSKLALYVETLLKEQGSLTEF